MKLQSFEQFSTKQIEKIRTMLNKVELAPTLHFPKFSKGGFERETSFKSSYGGHFGMTDRVVPLRSTQQSSISLGSYITSDPAMRELGAVIETSLRDKKLNHVPPHFLSPESLLTSISDSPPAIASTCPPFPIRIVLDA